MMMLRDDIILSSRSTACYYRNSAVWRVSMTPNDVAHRHVRNSNALIDGCGEILLGVSFKTTHL